MGNCSAKSNVERQSLPSARQSVVCRRAENYRHMSMSHPSAEMLKDRREMQTLLTMAAVVLFITAIIILGRLEFQLGHSNMVTYGPAFWLFGVIIVGAIINTIDYFNAKRRRKMLAIANVQSLLAEMNFPESFPCLLPGPHDECCGGRGIPTRPLPTYDELIVSDETETPPAYNTAVSMLNSSTSTTTS